MTALFADTPTFSMLFLLGIVFMLYGTVQAVRQKDNLKQLILWGGVADFGLLSMGFAAGTPTALTGGWLFLGFQFLARALAYSALCHLAGDVLPTRKALRGAGSTNALAGALFALGLLGSLGGSPFLVPEGRVFLVQGIIQTHLWGGIPLMILTALCSTVFVWLSVNALRIVCLEKHEFPKRSWPYLSIPLGILVALAGLCRAQLTGLAASWTGTEPVHAHAHPAMLVLFFGAFATALVGLKSTHLRSLTAFGVCLIALLTAFFSAAEPVNHLFLLLVTFVGFLVALYSIGYMAKAHSQNRYWLFLLLTFSSLAGIVTTTDLAAFYGFWELMTFASYFLVIHEEDQTAFSAGLKYYTMCAGGALLMLPGLLLLGGGETALLAVSHVSTLLTPGMLQCALVLILAGFAVKAGLVPLHSWLPDAHPAAPSSVSGPLSGIITKMGIFGLLTIVMNQGAQQMPGASGLSWAGYGISFMGAITLIYGEYMALMQKDIKRMLAYSTLGQLGEIALVLGLGTWLATAGVLAHIISHALMKDLLFLGAGALILRVGSRNLEDLRGLGRSMPWTVSCMVIALLTIMGLPPFTGFFSKYLMIQAAVQSGFLWVAALILTGSLVGAVYYTRILKTLVFDERPAHLPPVKEAPWSIRLTLLLLAALCLLFGLAPQLPLALILPAASALYVPSAAELLITGSVLVSWPVFVIFPILGALLPIFFRNDRRKAGFASATVLGITAFLVLLFGRNLDTLSFCFALIVPLIGMLNMFYAVGYMEHSHTQWRFYSAFLCMCAGLIGVASSTYLFSFFLFWEIMSSWTLFLAIAHEGTRDALREAFKYFFFNLLGAGFIFVGVCVLGAQLPLSVSGAAMASLTLSNHAATLGMVLLAIGFVMKAAQLPIRIDWQMHPALAPTPVSGYISSVLLKSALLGLLKLFMLFGGGLLLAGLLNASHEAILRTTIMWIGAVTIVMAAVYALRSTSLKLVFIYSTVSQIGYMVLAVAAGSALGYAGGMLHLINHIFFKDLLFLICGAVMLQTHKDSLADLGGIGRKMPFTLTMFAIAGLAVVGVPPTSGFSSKWIIYQALMQAGQPFLALLSLIGSVITLAYIAKFLHAAFLGQPSPELEKVREAPRSMRVPMGILGFGCLFSGIFPGIFLMPINAILTEYGMPALDVSLSGLATGPGAWNATGMSLMMILALGGGWMFLRAFTKDNCRETDVHVCGLGAEEATTRMQPSDIFAGPFHRSSSRENNS